MPQSFVLASLESNAPSAACDCPAHRFGNAADGPDRVRCYGSDQTEAEWQVIRPLPEHPGVRYVEVVPARTHYKIFLHTLEDVGHESFADLVEFPPLDPDNDEEEYGLLIGTRDDPLAALEAAEDATGAVRGKWVNTGLAQAEYHDYLSAGRPTKTAPARHPWPVPPFTS